MFLETGIYVSSGNFEKNSSEKNRFFHHFLTVGDIKSEGLSKLPSTSPAGSFDGEHFFPEEP